MRESARDPRDSDHDGEQSREWPHVWRSAEERGAAGAAAPDFDAQMALDRVDRRAVLRLMAASLALSGANACGESAAPLFSQPRGEPGVARGGAVHFATSLDLDGYGRGVLVTARNGRPVKIEGNPIHPATLGATDVFLQAEVLSLYDPDRSRAARENGVERSWSEARGMLQRLRAELRAERGAGLRVLLPPMASPTRDRLVQALQQDFPEAGWHVYGPMVGDNERAGAELTFGRVVDQVYDLRQTDVIVALGGDLFSEAPGHIRYAMDYVARRRDETRAPPLLYAAESRPSLAGARADRRLILRPREIEDFAYELMRELEAPGLVGGARSSDAAIMARALTRAGALSLAVVGREQPPAVHVIAHTINARLGAAGRTVRYIAPVLAAEQGEMQSLKMLAEALAAESVTRLLILGGNPVYDAPGDLKFAELVRSVPFSVHLGEHVNESAAACRWHLPERHALESWGDLRAFDGTAGLRQPAAVPLSPGMTSEALLATLLGDAAEPRELVQATWRAQWGDDFDRRWFDSLEKGVVEDSAARPLDVRLRAGAIEARGSAPTDAAPPGSLAAILAPDPSIWDGRYAGNAWLQELPKPLTKQVWGNAALIAPATAQARGLKTGDIVALSSEGRTIEAPVFVLPGQADDTLTLTLGYGRTRAGRVGTGVGFNAYPLRSADQPWTLADVAMRPTGRRETIITTQHHNTMAGREIVRVVAERAPPSPPPLPPQPSFYPEWEYRGRAWAMAIDLDACIGCNACVAACQAENNVPVVGPAEVARGREMHWLRIDRYYAGAPGAPLTLFQPMLCMHCEKAPCEVVCPVNATVHDSEGVNQMVYNRCIGTRTCSNNCPYKVRRFNWYDYTRGDYAPPEPANNPEVTVRGRGVMEKCTYCIQRIWTARIEAGIEKRPIRDGELVTACQQACPTRAFAFGDLNDPNSEVNRWRASARNYALLGHLNTQPRTTYLARVQSESPAQGGTG